MLGVCKIFVMSLIFVKLKQKGVGSVCERLQKFFDDI